jgi:ariadne-1
MGPWTEHNTSTGGFYRCNKYEEQKTNEDRTLLKEEDEREKAKTELDKYMWYFERYNNHEKAQRIANL